MKKYLNLLLFFLISPIVFSQVGINVEKPNPKTLLHVSEQNETTDPVQSKGIIIPRLTETQRNSIKPTATENSLLIYNITENCYNYWNNEESEWKSLCGNMGNAKFTFKCDKNIKIKGTYVKGKELDITNYISIVEVNVTKPGAYTIIATPTKNNGYSFVAQGVFTTAGKQTISLSGQGIPVNVQKDDFTITSSGSSDVCKTQVEVKPNIASYSINCATVNVTGFYLKGSSLSSLNTILMNVSVSSAGSYYISTNTVNGVSFQASGVFASTGTQTVILTGTGIPTVNTNFSVDITSNSIAGNTSCSATIPITLPSMKYAIIGDNSVYSWGADERLAALNSTANFGPNGIVKVNKLEQLWKTTSASTATNHLSGTAAKPDIILYFSYSSPPDDKLVAALNNYVNNGGMLIYGTADGYDNQANQILKGIFGITTAKTQVAGSGATEDNTYPINNLSSDPIINGPFGKTAGRYWAEDNVSTNSVIVTKLPPHSVQVATAYNSFGKPAVDPEYSIVWYNENKNFVFFGDSVGASTNYSSENSYPAYYSAIGIPSSKYYGNHKPGGGSSPQYVYNSILELNAVAWGLKKAAIAGINPH
ncbi:MAG: hypothetical protein LBP34_02995 [Flavobacteriaceae bacterium]|jgi:hypothetical protein|nr:hypothetical protein [Flavobacteriaceae bacterium]